MGKKKGKKKTKAKPILTTGGDEIINSFDVDDGHPQSVPPQPTDDVWLVMMEEEVKSMKTSQIKTELELMRWCVLLRRRCQPDNHSSGRNVTTTNALMALILIL